MQSAYAQQVQKFDSNTSYAEEHEKFCKFSFILSKPFQQHTNIGHPILTAYDVSQRLEKTFFNIVSQFVPKL